MTKTLKGFNALALTVAFAIFALPMVVVTSYGAAPVLTGANLVGGSEQTTSDVEFRFTSDSEGLIIFHGPCGAPAEPAYAVVGTNTVNYEGLAEGDYADCKVVVVNDNAEFSNPLTIPSFSVDTMAPSLTVVEEVETPTKAEIGAQVATLLSDEDVDLSTTAESDCTISSPLSLTADTETEVTLSAYDSTKTVDTCVIVATDASGNETETALASFDVELADDVTLAINSYTTPSQQTIANVVINSSVPGTVSIADTEACGMAETEIGTGNTTVQIYWLDGAINGTGIYADGDCELTFESDAGNAAFLPVYFNPTIVDNQSVTITAITTPAAGANGSDAEFTVTTDEGGAWSIVDGAAGTCSAELTAQTGWVAPGAQTVILESLTESTSFSTDTNQCDFVVTDGAGFSDAIRIPAFSMGADNDGPQLVIEDVTVDDGTNTVTVEFTADEAATDASLGTTALLSGVTVASATLNGVDFVDPATQPLVDGDNVLEFVVAEDGVYNVQLAFEDDNGALGNYASFSFEIDGNGPVIEGFSYTTGAVDNPVSITFESNEDGYFMADVCSVDDDMQIDFVEGMNTITLDALQGSVLCTLTPYDTAGYTAADETVDVDINDDANPRITGVSVDPVALTLTFTSSEAGTLEFASDSYCTSVETEVMEGKNTVQLNPLPDGLLVDSCEFTVTEVDGAESDTSNAPEFTVALETTDFVTYPDGTVYRFWNLRTGSTHFYTMSAETAEFVYDNTLAGGLWPGAFTQEVPTFAAWAYDETAEACADEGAMPVYRYLNTTQGDTHFYAISAEEIAALEGPFADTFEVEGIEFCAFEEGAQPADAVPVYRWLNTVIGSTHFYTASETERDVVDNDLSDVFQYEGVSFYALPFSM